MRERVAAAVAAGIAHERIVIDPGFGFGKTLGHNLDLLRGLAAFNTLGVPVSGRSVAQIHAGRDHRTRSE